jgi:glycerol-3-phosphate acyltransferase PlsX
MRVGIDISGGDFAPLANIRGAILAKKTLQESVSIVLIGNQEEISIALEAENTENLQFEIVHAPDVITMLDHPARAFTQKTKSSISVGFEMLSKGKLNAFASTGNTGAMLVGSIYKIKNIPGIIRPCITSTLPAINGANTILLDVGSNADCRADVLHQFAILGSLYSKYVHGVKKPRVALLNIGEEETKGNLVTQATYKLLAESEEIFFTGNIEGRDIFQGLADVIVCDGFTGNIVLKEAECIYTLLKQRGIQDEYFERFNYENYGGTPILGVKGNVIIGHGISNDIAVKNMLLLAFDVAKSNLSKKINRAFN